MGQIHKVVISLYPIQETKLSPGLVEEGVDSRAPHFIDQICSVIVTQMCEHGQLDSIYVDWTSEFHAFIPSPVARLDAFDISINSEPCEPLSEDMLLLINRPSRWHNWLISSIDVDGIELKTLEDCKDYLKYLFEHDMIAPSESIIRSRFYEWRESELQSYQEEVAARQRFVEQGKLDPQYVYRWIPEDV